MKDIKDKYKVILIIIGIIFIIFITPYTINTNYKINECLISIGTQIINTCKTYTIIEIIFSFSIIFIVIMFVFFIFNKDKKEKKNPTIVI